ncbi:thiamine pyrophosphate-dependent enzyme [Siccirubricoccus sp. G192]|uniref:thiamine pyrophosphate-dependent enzyme n=1 Tax=Siccirubricoccus sp. G192 TaxID=2849651 RepID=UPI0020C54DA8|nr:thiamine pyrophosphate-dependent enzyme [Siccirubricoccus sp. G192]
MSQSLTTAHNAKRMYRFDLTQRLVARLRNDEAVIGGIGNSNFDLWSAGHRAQNFYMLGSMGLAIPIALGVALAQPRRKVFALEGDGSLLMQLGCLSTVAALAPKNLAILVFDNGVYQITGGQPTPASGGTDYAAIARACGLPGAVWAADEADFERLVQHCLETDGPHFIGLKLDDQPPVSQTERDPAQIRDRFMRGMGAKKSKLPG